MNYKTLFFCCYSIILFSCASTILKNGESYKRITYPGLATQKPFITYIIDFESKSDFTLNDVKLNNTAVTFDVLSKNDNAYTKELSSLKAGEYSISFKTSELDDINNDDTVTLFYSINDKKREQQFIIEKRKPIRRR